MTNADALIAAAEAQPDEDTPRLVWLDALEELVGTTDHITACREFYDKCREPRRYAKYHHTGATVIGDEESWDHRRALPGWREWLGSGGEWFRKDGVVNKKPGSGGGMFCNIPSLNWHRLVPTLWNMVADRDRWRRVGARIDLRLRGPREDNQSTGYYKNCHIDLTFARGFLARVEFRSWRDADALLPAILADQPFCEVGIRGEPQVSPTRDWRQLDERWIGTDIPHSKGGSAMTAFLSGDGCGPALELVGGDLRSAAMLRRGDNHILTKVFPALTKNDAETRARLALSVALKKRARSAHLSPTLPTDRHSTPSTDSP